MKRKTLISAICLITVSALLACGCGKKDVVGDGQTETTIASQNGPQAAGGEKATAAPAETVYFENADEENFVEGVIVSMSPTSIFLKADDGADLSFGIANAQRQENDGLLPTCYAEISYLGTYAPGMDATTITVLNDIEAQAANNNVDPVMTGTVSILDNNDLVITDLNGVERCFNALMARKVSFGEIGEGTEVKVTYCGTLMPDEEDIKNKKVTDPIAIKIVAADAYGSEEAEKNYVIGFVSTVSEDSLVIDNYLDSFTFSIKPGQADGFAEGEQVKVYYSGIFETRGTTADSIEKY